MIWGNNFADTEFCNLLFMMYFCLLFLLLSLIRIIDEKLIVQYIGKFYYKSKMYANIYKQWIYDKMKKKNFYAIDCWNSSMMLFINSSTFLLILLIWNIAIALLDVILNALLLEY